MVWVLVQLRSGARARLADDLVAAAPDPEDETGPDWPETEPAGRSPDATRPAVPAAALVSAAGAAPGVTSPPVRRRPPWPPRPSPCRPGAARPSIELSRVPRLVPRTAGRARRSAPTGPRQLARRARRPPGPAGPVVHGRARRRDDGPAHVPPRRAVPDALRRGLPRADGDRVPAGLALRHRPRHLRVDPPAPRQVRRWPAASSCGARTTSARRATSASPVTAVGRRAAPRRRADGGRAGERLHVATGTEIRTYDLRTRALIGAMAAPGATALAMSATGSELIVGYDDGRIATMDVESMGRGGLEVGLAPVDLGPGVGSRVDDLLAARRRHDAAGRVRRPPVDGGRRLRRRHCAASTCRSSSTWRPAGPAPRSSARRRRSTTRRPSRPRSRSCSTGMPARSRPSCATADRHGRARQPRRWRRRKTNIQAAIDDGTLPGIEITEVDARRDGDGRRRDVHRPGDRRRSSRPSPRRAARTGWRSSPTWTIPQIYATVGTAEDPKFDVIAVGGDRAKDGPVVHGPQRRCRARAPRSSTTAPPSMVHVLGLAPGRVGDADRGRSTSIEPHGNAVFADARLPDGFTPASWAADFEPEYPSDDRQQLLLFTADGASASIDAGSHAFAWRLPGVIAGAITAALLYLLPGSCSGAATWPASSRCSCVFDGMFFVQSRIGMNDVYVGPVHHRRLHPVRRASGRAGGGAAGRSGSPCPSSALLLGLALVLEVGRRLRHRGAGPADPRPQRARPGRWRSSGMIGITAVLGYLAITVPEGQGFGNLTFLLIMVGLTLIGVVTAILHPVAWTDEEMRFAVAAPAVLGALVFVGRGRARDGEHRDHARAARVHAAPGRASSLALGSGVVAGAVLARRSARVRAARVAARRRATRRSYLDPPTPAPDGWLRPGWLLGLPVVYAAICLVVAPARRVRHLVHPVGADRRPPDRRRAGRPATTGQTLLDLTGQMYRYHNGLTAAHPASSPWWAWPFNLKPVWFYQEGLAAGHERRPVRRRAASSSGGWASRRSRSSATWRSSAGAWR